MAKVYAFSTIHGPLYVESLLTEPINTGVRKAGASDIAKSTVEAASTSLEDALVTVFAAAEAFVANAASLTRTPDELNVEFGLKISGQLNAFIVSGNTEANFVVKMKWAENEKPAPKTPPA